MYVYVCACVCVCVRACVCMCMIISLPHPTDTSQGSGSSDPAHYPAPSDPPPTVCPPNSMEHKMAEMAEMYGEIMELNERLHRDIASKNGVIVKLVHCIRQAGLKVGVASYLLIV